MQVVCPYTNLRPETREALDRLTEPFYVSLEGDTAYWTLLSELWVAAEPFVIVEHDIVIHDTVMPEFEACEKDWCAFGYQYYAGGPVYGLGCMKFGARIMQAYPDALHEVGRRYDASHPPKHWCRLDGTLQNHLMVHGEYLCCHDSQEVTHLSTEISHGCSPSWWSAVTD